MPNSPDEERNRPHPLNGKRQAPCNVAFQVESSTNDTGRQKDADTPAHVDLHEGRLISIAYDPLHAQVGTHVASQVTTQVDRAHLGRVRSRERLENTPGDTTKDFGGDEHTERVGEEKEEDEGGESGESDKHGRLGTVAFRD